MKNLFEAATVEEVKGRLGACLTNQFSDYRLRSSSSVTTTNCACSIDFWNTRTRS
jgi:hypothetical protein